MMVDFVRLCARALSDAAHDDGTRRGAEALTSSMVGATHTPDRYESGWLPALDTVDMVGGSELADEFVRIAPLLPWHQASQAGTDTALIAVSPLDLVVDVGSLRLGLMYLAPGARTALHHHPPQEAYLLLSGQSEWRYGGSSEFRSLDSPAAIYNHPDDLHAAVAGDTPLVSMFVLWDSPQSGCVFPDER